MRHLILPAILCFFIHSTVRSQKPFELGPEYMRLIGKGYNTHAAGIRGETFRNKGSFSIGLTYTFSASNSYSFSNGFNLYGGYRYAFGTSANGSNPFVGVKILYSLVSWEGKSSLFSPMLTPIAEAGYHFVFAKHIFAAPAVGYGYTLRIIPDYNSLDEDAGGRIVGALSAGYRF